MTTLGRASCYDPEPYPQFSTISRPFISHSQLLIPHSFPHALLGPPPNHLTSHLMDHLTNSQSDITCHHSAVRSILQHHHLPLYELPVHCQLMMWSPAHDGAILRLPAHCQLMMNLTICDLLFCDSCDPLCSHLYINPCTFNSWALSLTWFQSKTCSFPRTLQVNQPEPLVTSKPFEALPSHHLSEHSEVALIIGDLLVILCSQLVPHYSCDHRLRRRPH